MREKWIKGLCRGMAVLILLLSALLSGCSPNPAAELYDNESAITSDSNTYNLDGITQQVVDDTYEVTVEKMEGMDTVWSFDSDYEDEITVSYSVSLQSGRLKLVLISPDGTLTTLVECSPDMGRNGEETISIIPGENRIKIVTAEDTEFTLDLSIPEGEFQELGF